MKKRKKKIPVKLVSGIFIILILLVLLSVFLWQALIRIDYFKVKDIIIIENSRITDLSYLKGRNIWSLDLERESRLLSLYNPTYRRINLVRVLPNRIFVDIQPRQPLAFVKLGRFFLVDREEVLFDIPEDASEMELPVILGLNNKLVNPASGKKYNLRELWLALNIIREFENIKALSSLKIKKINAESAGNLSFFLSDKLEIKIGQEDVLRKLNILKDMLLQSGNDLANIKYIDLRFQEPVVKLNNAK